MTEFFSAYPVPVLAAVGVIFVVGGITKGALGFGLPLVTMSLLPLFIPVETALALNALATPFNNIAQLRRGGQARAVFDRFGGVVATTALGIVIGALFVSYVEERFLLLALGIFVVIFTMLSLLTPDIHIPARREKPLGLAVGLVAGVVGALTTANGPVYIMYLLGLRLDRVTFVSTLGLFFIVTGIVLSGSFLLLGMLSAPIAMLALLCLFAAQFGMRVGFWSASKVSTERFRLVVLIALAVLGVNLILQGLST